MGKRIALVKLTGKAMVEVLFSTREFLCWSYCEDYKDKFTAKPKDIKFVGIEYKARYDIMIVTLESPDFKEVPQDGIIPQIIPELKIPIENIKGGNQ